MNDEFVATSEDGFDVTLTAGAEPRIQDIFPPAPFTGNYLLADRLNSVPNVITITEQDTATPFQFLGLDGGTTGVTGQPNLVDIMVEGFIGGTGGTLVGRDVFPQSGEIYTTFDTVNLLGKSVDTVVISLGYAGGTDTPAFVDNIRLDTDPAAAPIPAPLALMVPAMFGIVTLRRRRSIAA